MSFRARLECGFVGTSGVLNWNVEPSRHMACMIAESLQATATQARSQLRFLAIFRSAP